MRSLKFNPTRSIRKNRIQIITFSFKIHINFSALYSSHIIVKIFTYFLFFFLLSLKEPTRNIPLLFLELSNYPEHTFSERRQSFVIVLFGFDEKQFKNCIKNDKLRKSGNCFTVTVIPNTHEEQL